MGQMLLILTMKLTGNMRKKNIGELTKTHRADDKEMVSAMMPEQPASPFCPVRSFEKKSISSYIRFAIAFGKDHWNPR